MTKNGELLILDQQRQAVSFDIMARRFAHIGKILHGDQTDDAPSLPKPPVARNRRERRRAMKQGGAFKKGAPR